MLLLVPVVCWIILVLLFRKREGEWRAAILGAAVAFGVLLTAITEILSIFRLLSFTALWLTWLAASLVLGAVYFVTPRRVEAESPRETSWLPLSEFWPLLGVAVIALAVAVTALVAPPNTWDSLTYHMVRVLYWMQNQSVAHYPSHELRQLYMQPGSEYFLLHCQVLSDGDHFANFMQWLTMVGSMIGVSLVAKHLGAGPYGQLFAAVVCATIPMGILQASSSRNDYCVSFWLVCFAYYILRGKAQPSSNSLFLGGASLGLALLTKAMAYLFAPPLLLLLGWGGLKTLFSKFWREALLVPLIVLVLNAGHYVRNYAMFRDPLQPPKEALFYSVSNETFELPAIVSSVLRNAGIHFITTPFDHVNRLTEQAVHQLHDLLGIDLNDPRTTFLPEDEKFAAQRPEHARGEDTAGSPVHFCLFVLSVPVCLLVRKVRAMPGLVLYAAALVLGFLLFCTYVKFMHGSVRYQLTVLVLAAPFIAVVLTELLPGRIVDMLTLLLLLGSLPFAFTNLNRPLLGAGSILTTDRTDLYFQNPPETRDYLTKVYDSFEEAVEFLRAKGHRQIGIICDDFEYAFWALFPEIFDDGGRFEHVNVEHTSPIGPIPHSPGFVPTAIAWIDPQRLQGRVTFHWKDTWNLGDVTYRRAFSNKAIRIWVLK